MKSRSDRPDRRCRCALATRHAIAHVLPLARRDPEARFANNAAAGTVRWRPRGTRRHRPSKRSPALFGLTAGEKRVVRDVAEGKSRKDIALSHKVSDETIENSTCHECCDKTGISSQRQLEQLIRDVTPPVSVP